MRDHADVRAALAELHTGLRSAGLLRAFPPHRTRTARRALNALSAEQPLPTSRKGLSEYDTLMAVALYGEPALHVLVPRFALRAGYQKAGEQDSEVGFTAGGGAGGTFDVYAYRLDYAWAAHGRLGSTHRISVGMTF